jgi:hypothetical protein
MYTHKHIQWYKHTSKVNCGGILCKYSTDTIHLPARAHAHTHTHVISVAMAYSAVWGRLHTSTQIYKTSSMMVVSCALRGYAIWQWRYAKPCLQSFEIFFK